MGDPQAILASGNVMAILALIIVILSGVVIYLVRLLLANQKDSAIEIKALNAQLYTESKSHAADYKEMANKDQEVLQLNSQANTLLATKIEAVKGR